MVTSYLKESYNLLILENSENFVQGLYAPEKPKTFKVILEFFLDILGFKKWIKPLSWNFVFSPLLSIGLMK